MYKKEKQIKHVGWLALTKKRKRETVEILKFKLEYGSFPEVEPVKIKKSPKKAKKKKRNVEEELYCLLMDLE